MAKSMLEKQKIEVNPFKCLFIKDNKRRTAVKMFQINAAEALQDIPVVIEEYLRSLTFDVYQLKQVLSYSSEHVSEDDGYVGQK